MIYVDKEGSWFHNGSPIIHRGFILLFYQLLRLDDQGRYIIKLNDQVCRLDVEDTPFVVVRASFVAAGNDGERDRFVLHLTDDTQEELDPTTLSSGPDHVLYCKIRGGKFPARFSRPSYYQLAHHVEEDLESGGFFVLVNGKKYFIKGIPGAESARDTRS